VSERVAQVRGILAERVVVSTPLDPFFTLRALSSYSGIGVSKLRQYIELPVDEALPCFRLPGGGKILVRRSAFDAWMSRFEARGRPSLVRAMQELGLKSH